MPLAKHQGGKKEKNATSPKNAVLLHCGKEKINKMSEFFNQLQILLYALLFKAAEVELWAISHTALVCAVTAFILMFAWFAWEVFTDPELPYRADYEGQRHDSNS